MAKITLNVEAESFEELQEALKGFQSGEAVKVTIDDTKAVGTKQEVTKKATKKKQTEVSTDLTSDTEPLKRGEQQEPLKEKKETFKEEPVKKSKTAGKYPDATKADVQKAMKEAMTAGKKDAILTAFSRLNATKLSELAEEDYSVFLTDLEVLVGE
jgi:TusA-related sulfurtransferase